MDWAFIFEKKKKRSLLSRDQRATSKLNETLYAKDNFVINILEC